MAEMTSRERFKRMFEHKDADRVLFETGRMTGASVGRTSDEKLGFEEFTEFIYNHWLENGLGRPVVRVEGEDIILDIEDSSEAMDENGPCSFSKGYLEGITCELTGKDYECIEEQCITGGSDICIMRLKPKQ